MKRVAFGIAALAAMAVTGIVVAQEQQKDKKPQQEQRPRRQFPLGARAMFGGQLFLLQNPAVQKELKLTDDQNKAFADIGAEQQALFEGYQNLSPFDQEARDKENGPKIEAISKKVDAAVKEKLTEAQQKRLRQLRLQTQARFALSATLSEDGVATELGISDEQRQKIKAIADETAKARETLMKQAEAEGAAFNGRQQFQALTEKESEQAMKVLDDKQKDQWKTLLGEPFEIGFGGPGRRTEQPPAAPKKDPIKK